MSRPMRLLAIRSASPCVQRGRGMTQRAPYRRRSLGANCPLPAATRGSEVGEPERDLAGGRLLAVRAVHEVLPVGQRQISADGAGGGLATIGGPVDGSDHLDRLVALEDQGDEWPAGDEVPQWRVEVTFHVVCVVLV